MTALPEPKVTEQDGFKVLTEYKINEKGQTVKVTRKYKKHYHKHKTTHAIAERAHLTKFGRAAAKSEDDLSITMLGEEVFLKLSMNPNFDDEKQALTVDEQMKKIKTANITCRVCKGDHWTSKCPYKDTLAPLDESMAGATAETSSEEAAGAGSAGGSALAAAFGGSGSSRYVPPSMRAGAGGAAAGAAAAGGAAGSSLESRFSNVRSARESDANTLRVTNLSEDSCEEDVYRLFSRFGRLQRVFVSTDRDTGLCKGFAFVTFYDRHEAERAKNKLDGFGFDSLILQVDWAQSKQ